MCTFASALPTVTPLPDVPGPVITVGSGLPFELTSTLECPRQYCTPTPPARASTSTITTMIPGEIRRFGCCSSGFAGALVLLTTR